MSLIACARRDADGVSARLTERVEIKDADGAEGEMNSHLCLSHHRQLHRLFRYHPKALFGFMNAPRVHACVGGCCRNVLLLHAHPRGVFHSAPCALTWPRAFAGWGDAGTLWDVPCLCGTGDNRHRGTGPGAEMGLGLCLWPPPARLWLAKPQQDPSAQCQERAALQQVTL